jgi:hypothetical protein
MLAILKKRGADCSAFFFWSKENCRFSFGERSEENLVANLKRMLVGRALRTEQAAHERLPKKTALAVFSSDALSSVAYSTEAILLVLLAAALWRSSTCLTSQLVSRASCHPCLSYRQTIHAYPRGRSLHRCQGQLGTRRARCRGLVAG